LEKYLALKRKEVIERWKKLQNKELHILYSSPDPGFEVSMV
jgi:hypothetical protein